MNSVNMYGATSSLSFSRLLVFSSKGVYLLAMLATTLAYLILYSLRLGISRLMLGQSIF